MQIIRYDHDIVAERGCDTFFFKLTSDAERMCEYDEPTRLQHLSWFKDWDLTVETVGFLGLLIGDAGYYYVDFRDANDPRLDQWSKLFEDADGNSLEPDKYKMFVYPYQMYLDKKPIDPEDW
jgi:hypothetical protein